MTIDEAIELQLAFLKNIAPQHITDLNKAMKLGIEALKAIKLQRKNPQIITILRLTGEIEE